MAGMKMKARAGPPPGIAILYEFITPDRTGAANRHMVLLFGLFFIISMADVVTTTTFLSLGGWEGNAVVRNLILSYGTGILVPYKLFLLGILGGTIGISWRGLGVEPRRFFWAMTLMTLVTVSIVISNIAYILSLL